MSKSRVVTIFALLIAIVALAGCGGSGGSAKLTSDDVAVVGDIQISKSQFTDLMATAEASFKQQGKPFPKEGTTEYQTIQSQAVTLLVQQAEREQKAKDLGVEVTDQQVDKRLAEIKKQYFGGSDSKYQEQLKQQGLTEQQVRSDIKAQLVSEALFAKVTKDVTVSDKEISDYYASHTANYKQPESRQVRHILVKSESLANTIYIQLRGGADFAKLAKKYSLDTASAAQGGDYHAIKGQSVAPFDKVAFALKTNEISKPVKTTYGWHVIQATGDVKPAGTTPEKDAAAQIKQQLLQTAKNSAVNDWAKNIQKSFCSSSRIKFQTGFTPNPDPCAAAASATTTG